jgi:hypothetical protein
MKKLLALCLLLLSSLAQGQTCTQTLSAPSSNLASVISAAAGGSVICLNSGAYATTGGYSINARPSSRVTIRSVSGNAADVTLDMKEIYRSTNLTFRNVTMSDVNISDFGSAPANSNLSFINVIWSSGAVIVNGGLLNNSNILFYGNTFANAYQSTGVEGTLYFTCDPACSGSVVSGVKVQHSLFDGSGACADGIQITGGHSGITIGPGNVFRDWVQGSCGPHVDAWQIVGGEEITVDGNHFENNTINVGIYDGSANVRICNNVFNGQNSGDAQSFQIGGVQGMTFCHNTLRNVTNTGIGTKTGDEQNSGWVIENNLLVNSSLAAAGDQPGCGSDCIVRYNLRDASSGLITGATNTNNTVGTANFVGPLTSPTARFTPWPGFALAGGSPGKAAGNDGKDQGTNFFNPAAPSSFQQN